MWIPGQGGVYEKWPGSRQMNRTRGASSEMGRATATTAAMKNRGGPFVEGEETRGVEGSRPTTVWHGPRHDESGYHATTFGPKGRRNFPLLDGCFVETLCPESFFTCVASGSPAAFPKLCSAKFCSG